MSFSRQGVLILLEDLRQALNLNKIKQALRSCFEFLQKVFLGLMYLFSCVALGDFLVLFAPVLRQIARYLPHHRSENASKTHPNHRTINSKQLLN